MERMVLPDGYRLVTTAPEVWVLVEVHASGEVVARYRGELVPEQVEHDAREHATDSAHDTNGPTDTGASS